MRYEDTDGDLKCVVANRGGDPNDINDALEYDGNYDKDAIMSNTLPYPILTKRMRVYPTDFRGSSPALRVEYIGCKAGCIMSHGVAQDTVINGQPPLGHIPASAMTASSEVVGSEASNGRVCYDNANCNTSPHNPSSKKTWQTSQSKKSYETSRNACATQSGGGGILGKIFVGFIL